MEHVHTGRCEHVFPGLSAAEAESRGIVDLISEFNDDYIVIPYMQRMLARTLGHAGLAVAEAKAVWKMMGQDEGIWYKFADSFSAAAA